MEAIGSEVGQKMRSAIKAKLMELGCYVDDELPDYVMVMVANKRTRSQMEEDLQLFLATNTEAFVGWLHQVLQKLQEVTIKTNFVTGGPKKSKTKHSALSNPKKERREKEKKKDKSKVKAKMKSKEKEKKSKKDKLKKSKPKESESIRPNVPPLYMNLEKESSPSITDIFAGQILKSHGIKVNTPTQPQVDSSVTESKPCETEDKTRRKLLNRNRFPIIDPSTVSQLTDLTKVLPSSSATTPVDSFDIPSISEIELERDKLAALPREEKIKEFNEINAKIQTLKKKLAEQMESGSEDEDFINLRTEAEELMGVDFNEDISLPSKEPVVEIKTPPLLRAVTPPSVSEPDSFTPIKVLPKVVREPVRPPDKSPVRSSELPQIELNLPKRPMRDRLGARPPSAVGSSESSTTNRNVNMVNPYQSNAGRQDNGDGSNDRSRSDRLTKITNDKNSIKSRLTFKEDNNSDKPKQRESETSSKDEAMPKRRLGSRVVPLPPEEETSNVSVASVVRAPPRPVGASGGPASQLLLRAVADAHKSLLSMPPKNNMEPTPKKKALVLPMRRNVDPKKIIIQVPSDKVPTPNAHDSRDDNSDYEIDMDTESLGDLESDSDNRRFPHPENAFEYVPEPVRKKSSNFKSIDYVPTHIDSDDRDPNKIELPVISRILHFKTEKDSQQKKDPQFVVTLEGVDPNMFLEKKLGKEIEEDESKNASEDSKKGSPNSDNKQESDKINTDGEENNSNSDIKNGETKKSDFKTNPLHRTNLKISFDKSMYKRPDQSLQKYNKLEENKVTEANEGSDSCIETSQRKTLPQSNKRKLDTSNEDSISRKKSLSPIIFSTSEKKIKIPTDHAESASKYDSLPSLPPDKKQRKTSLSLTTVRETARCRFYPDCRLGSSCEFYHPPLPQAAVTSPVGCRSFPNCLFGDKCAYGHPLCKFDVSCTRKGCPYVHNVPVINTKTKLINQQASVVSPVVASRVVPAQNYKSITASPLPPICRFYPNCSNAGCHFYHPKPCRFGKFCLNKVECNFYHHDVPSSTLKWTS